MFGETIGNVVGSNYDAGSKGRYKAQAYGSLFDMGYSYQQSRKDEAALDEITALQRQIAEAQMSAAAQSSADEAAYRARIIERINAMDTSLKSSMAKLGARTQVDGDDIAANYKTFRGQMMDDYYETVEMVGSQNKASAIRRGMDRSTQFTDTQAELIKKSTSQLGAIDQSAFDAAISRSKGFADAMNSGRSETFSELTSVLGKAAEMEGQFVTNNAPNQMKNASSALDGFGTNAYNNFQDSQSVMGDTMASFNEKLAPNFSYGFGDKGVYTDLAGGKDARRDAALRAAIGGDKYDQIVADTNEAV